MLPDQTTLRATTRTAAGFLAVVALLLQLFVAPDLAMRMRSALSFDGWSALCASSTGQPGHPPALPHDHDTCPVCQTHAVPLGLVAAAILLLAPATPWRRPDWRTTATPLRARPFRLYRSRAPPTPA
jgi:hypothetical protein